MEKFFGIARVLNKRGYCSRSQAEALVRNGRVSLNGKIVRNPETPTAKNAKIAVDGKLVLETAFVYFAMNKPRGIVTTASDEKGRKPVMDLLEGKMQQHVFPIGRLDKASEGLLLFTNDTAFADKILAPETQFEKVYHVCISREPTEEELTQMQKGVLVPPRIFGNSPEKMRMEKVRILRRGEKNCWIAVILHEGKNREIRRILQTFEIEVLRLIRVRIGNWTLGDLRPGEIRKMDKI